MGLLKERWDEWMEGLPLVDKDSFYAGSYASLMAIVDCTPFERDKKIRELISECAKELRDEENHHATE